MTYQPEIPGMSAFDESAVRYLEQAQVIDANLLEGIATDSILSSIQDRVWGEFQSGILLEGQVAWNAITERLKRKEFSEIHKKDKHGYDRVSGLSWTFERLLRPNDSTDTVAIRTSLTAPIDKKQKQVINALSYGYKSLGRTLDLYYRRSLRGTEYEVQDYSMFRRTHSKRAYAAQFIANFLGNTTILKAETTYTVLGSQAEPQLTKTTLTKPTSVIRPNELSTESPSASYANFAYDAYGDHQPVQADLLGFEKWLTYHAANMIIGKVQNIKDIASEIEKTETVI